MFCEKIIEQGSGKRYFKAIKIKIKVVKQKEKTSFYTFPENLKMLSSVLDATVSIGPSLCSVIDGHHFLLN